jgi:hypothetical protein
LAAHDPGLQFAPNKIPKAAIVTRIRRHPALLSEADNVARHLSRSKKNS